MTFDPAEPPPPLPFYRRKSALLVGGAILLILAAVLGGPPALRGFKGWRASELAGKARAAMQAGDLQGATDAARAAIMLAPESPNARRAIAEIQTTARDPGSVSSWKQLLESGRATEDDRRAALECAIGFGRSELAREWLKPLMEHAAGDSRNLLLAAKTAMLNARRPQALELGQKAVAADPANRRARLFLGSVELLDGEKRDAGIEELFTLAASNEAEGIAAVETLARVPLGAPGTEQVIARLRTHPLSASSQKLLALALEVQLKPAERAAILDAAGAEYQKGDPKAFRDFCGWLNGTGESPRVLALLPLERAKTRKDLFLAWLDAEAALKHWEHIREVLGTKPVPLEDLYVELYLARCGDELKDDASSELHWRLAQVAAQGDAQQSLYLAAYAEKQGRADRAETAYRALSANPVLARAAYEGLLRLAQKQDTAALAAVLDAMHQRWPGDRAVQNDRIYYHLLLKRDTAEMLQAAQALVLAEPASLPHRTALALAYLRAGDVAAASKVYEGLSVDWDRAPSSAIAVYAAVLQAQNRDELASTFTRRVQPETLREEERLLLFGVH